MHPGLVTYLELLVRWSGTINLVSPGDLPHLWPRHVEDSLQLGTIAGPLPPRAIDMGSGAGFPGLVLALVHGIEVDLIEQDQRKAAFLREAIFVTGAPAKVHAVKVERAKVMPAPLIVSRALAPLATLLRFAVPLLEPNGFCLFPKTRAAETEIAEAERKWSMSIERLPSKTDPDGMILRISDPRSRG